LKVLNSNISFFVSAAKYGKYVVFSIVLNSDISFFVSAAK